MTDHADSGDEGLPLGFTPLRSLLMHHFRIEGLLLGRELLRVLLLLVELLLLDGGLELVLVLERLPLHLLLPLDTFLVSLAALLPHLLFLLQLVLVALQLELHLVFSLSLLHLLIELNRLAFLLLDDLSLLHLELPNSREGRTNTIQSLTGV